MRSRVVLFDALEGGRQEQGGGANIRVHHHIVPVIRKVELGAVAAERRRSEGGERKSRHHVKKKWGNEGGRIEGRKVMGSA